MFLPATQMLPRVGSSSFSRRRMNVDLPEPVGPTINTNSPLPISTDTLSRATTLSLYVFVTFSVLIMGKEGGRTARMLPDGAGQSNQLATRRLRELLQELPGALEEHGPHMVDEVLHGSLGLHGVARIDDRHVWQCPEAGDVLQGHLRVPVLTDADARMGPHDAHVGFLVRDGDPERLEPPGDEARERGRPRNLPRQRQTGGDPQHVSFGDADVDEPLRELLRELLGASRVPEISG